MSVRFAVFLLFGVFLMVSFSLSGASSFARASVVVSSVAWCPVSRSILVSSACGASFVCRVGRVPSVVASARGLWSSLVASRRAGVPVVLGFRAGWGAAARSGSFWFDAVGVVPVAAAEPASDRFFEVLPAGCDPVAVPLARPDLAPAPVATAWGVPVPA